MYPLPSLIPFSFVLIGPEYLLYTTRYRVFADEQQASNNFFVHRLEKEVKKEANDRINGDESGKEGTSVDSGQEDIRKERIELKNKIWRLEILKTKKRRILPRNLLGIRICICTSICLYILVSTILYPCLIIASCSKHRCGRASTSWICPNDICIGAARELANKRTCTMCLYIFVGDDRRPTVLADYPDVTLWKKKYTQTRVTILPKLKYISFFITLITITLPPDYVTRFIVDVR